MAQGYAHFSPNGEIDVRTVAPTERAAMVNAIYILTEGQSVRPDADEGEIEFVYSRRAPFGSRVAPVQILPLAN